MENKSTIDFIKKYHEYDKNELVLERDSIPHIEQISEYGKKKYDTLNFLIDNFKRHQEQEIQLKDSLSEISKIIKNKGKV